MVCNVGDVGAVTIDSFVRGETSVGGTAKEIVNAYDDDGSRNIEQHVAAAVASSSSCFLFFIVVGCLLL